ncbi:MAG: ABC transporter permease [Clostridia bacterium]|nr:ABC transporter permease [Clostridia bacterium]
MSRGLRYFRLQCKRFFKLFLAVFLLSAVLCGAMGFILGNLLEANGSDEQKQPVRIGFTGDLSDSYLQMGLAAAQNFDSTRFSVEFLTLEESEARRMLNKGELAAFLIVPERFFEKAVDGDLGKLTYVSSAGTVDFGTKITNDILKAAALVVFNSQKGTRGFIHAARAAGTEESEALRLDDLLVLKFVDYILVRSLVYSVNEIGFNGAESSDDSIIYGILILFLLLWGITCCTVFASRRRPLSRVLGSKGTGAFTQVAGEFAAYFLFMLTTVSVVLAAAIAMVGLFPDGIGRALDRESVIRAAAAFILPVLTVSAMQFFLYEITDGVISGVLLQFLVAVGMGYVTGCLYPSYFFPEGVQKVGALLPSGAAKTFLASFVAGKVHTTGLILLAAYFAVFFLLSVLLRKRNIAAEGGGV